MGKGNEIPQVALLEIDYNQEEERLDSEKLFLDYSNSHV